MCLGKIKGYIDVHHIIVSVTDIKETMSAERGSVAASVANQTMVLETASMLNNCSATFVATMVTSQTDVRTNRDSAILPPIIIRKYL